MGAVQPDTSGWAASRGRTQHAMSQGPGLDDTPHSPLHDPPFLETFPACPFVPKVVLGCNWKVLLGYREAGCCNGWNQGDFSLSSQTLLATFWLHPSKEYFENKMK